MEVLKQPETEMEYWGFIEELGGFRDYMGRQLLHDRIKDEFGGVRQDINDATDIQSKLVEEACEKFNLVHPKDAPKPHSRMQDTTAPEGKTYYWDWYHDRRKEFLSDEWDKMICSACPLNDGMEAFIEIGGRMISCKPFNEIGMLYTLRMPQRCAMTEHISMWSEEKLYSEIIKNSDQATLERFKKKQMTLTNPIT